jgi:hypothetical protein
MCRLQGAFPADRPILEVLDPASVQGARDGFPVHQRRDGDQPAHARLDPSGAGTIHHRLLLPEPSEEPSSSAEEVSSSRPIHCSVSAVLTASLLERTPILA